MDKRIRIIPDDQKLVMIEVQDMVCRITGENSDLLPSASHGSAMDAKSIIAKLLDIEEIPMVNVGIFLFGNHCKGAYALNRFYKNQDHHMLSNHFDRCIDLRYKNNG